MGRLRQYLFLSPSSDCASRLGKLWTEPDRVYTVSPVEREEILKISKARALARSGAARSIRLAARLSLSEMAAPIRVSAVTIYRWETGQRSPRGEAAARYAELLESLMGSPL